MEFDSFQNTGREGRRKRRKAEQDFESVGHDQLMNGYVGIILEGRKRNLSGNLPLPLYVFTSRLADSIALLAHGRIRDNSLMDLQSSWYGRRTLRRLSATSEENLEVL